MQAHLLLPEGIQDLLFPLLLLCSGGYHASGGLFCYTGMEWNLVVGHHLPYQKVSRIYSPNEKQLVLIGFIMTEHHGMPARVAHAQATMGHASSDMNNFFEKSKSTLTQADTLRPGAGASCVAFRGAADAWR